MNLRDFLKRRKRRRVLDRVNFSSVIGAGSHYHGTLNGAGSYLILGRVEGACDVAGSVMLGTTGYFLGNLKAGNAVIEGEVAGDVIADARVELRVGARVRGNIRGSVIAIAEGASYDGQIHMRPTPQITSFVEKRQVQGSAATPARDVN